MDGSKVVKPQPKKKIRKGEEGGKEKKGPVKVEEEEGGREVEKGDELDLVPASEAPPVKLVLSPNGPQDDGTSSSQKKVLVYVEPPEAEPGPLQALIYGQEDGQKKKKIGEVYAHGVDVEEPVNEAILKAGLVHVLKKKIEEAGVAKQEGGPYIKEGEEGCQEEGQGESTELCIKEVGS